MKLFYCIVISFSAVISNVASAGIIVGGTRVIYEDSKREASISIKNPEKSTPYLIQSWVESDNKNSVDKPPFVVTPPLFRIDSDQENTLRIIHTAGVLPDDHESVFWLNVKSIPSSEKSDSNQLQITVRTRIKLFYRPKGIQSHNASLAYKSLELKEEGNKIEINNPTPFHVSFYKIKVNGKEIKDAGMISPKSTLSLPAKVGDQITYQTINDYGGITPELRLK